MCVWVGWVWVYVYIKWCVILWNIVIDVNDSYSTLSIVTDCI